jgi:hypothetical protein
VGVEDDVMRTVLSRSIMFIVGAGLLAGVYARRPDAPIVATSPAQQSGASARLGAIATRRPIPNDPRPDAFVAMAIKPIAADVAEATIHSEGAKRLNADSLRAELAREPRSVGWGDSYAVRLMRPSGQPMVVAEIALIVQRADGTVDSIAMGALPEAGIYRATVPIRRSAPIDLQVGVGSGQHGVKIRVRRWQNAPPSISG